MPAKWQQWMPLHIDKWRGSPAVRAMHPAARMGYLELILSQWQTDDCSLPSDPLDLAELSGLGDELWSTYSARILRNFDALENGRIRNTVCLEEWLEAKRVFDARKASAEHTNTVRKSNGDRVKDGRSPSRPANTITGTVTETETLNTRADADADDDAIDWPVAKRIVCDTVGIHDMRQQSDMDRCIDAYAKASGKSPPGVVEHMTARWQAYRAESPSHEWQYGSAHKFFMSGKWDDPRSWPRGKDYSPVKIGGFERSLTEDEVEAMRGTWGA